MLIEWNWIIWYKQLFIFCSHLSIDLLKKYRGSHHLNKFEIFSSFNSISSTKIYNHSHIFSYILNLCLKSLKRIKAVLEKSQFDVNYHLVETYSFVANLGGSECVLLNPNMRVASKCLILFVPLSSSHTRNNICAYFNTIPNMA